MKQIIYILLTTTVLGLMSCSDWLDVSPKTSIPTDKQFESESGFKDALTVGFSVFSENDQCFY